jgi:hypothetical protein
VTGSSTREALRDGVLYETDPLGDGIFCETGSFTRRDRLNNGKNRDRLFEYAAFTAWLVLTLFAYQSGLIIR